MELQRLYSYTRQAVDKYNMINDGDKIAVGISGGKDSLTLLYALAGIKKFYPKKFEIVAISVNLGFDNQDFGEIQTLCNKLQVQLYVVDTEISEIVFNRRKESNPCSLCSKMRKGALNNEAIIHSCNKIAYAHHKDDIIETLMLSLFFEGRIHSFSPVTHLDGTNLKVIRPLMYVSEAEIIGFKNKYQLPVAKNKCPADGYTKREYIKQLIANLNRENPGIKERIFNAIEKSKLEGWSEIYGTETKLS